MRTVRIAKRSIVIILVTNRTIVDTVSDAQHQVQLARMPMGKACERVAWRANGTGTKAERQELSGQRTCATIIIPFREFLTAAGQFGGTRNPCSAATPCWAKPLFYIN